jgi:hypothetical protein
VPYRDPDKQREYKKHWERMRKAGEPGSIAGSIPPPFRLRTAQDILTLLAKHVEAVEHAEEVGTLEKARTVGYLAGIALKAVEVTDLGARLAKLEQAVARKGHPVISLPHGTSNGTGADAPPLEETI